MCRFSIEMLNKKPQFVSGKRAVGLCIGGQNVPQLNHMISQNSDKVHKKVMLMIGTNDFLQRVPVNHICEKVKMLVEQLNNLKKELIILTIPPIPKLVEADKYHFHKLKIYNECLMSLNNNNNIIVLDTCKIFLNEKNDNQCNLYLFEKEINYNRSNTKVDLVHLNRQGFILLKDFITNALSDTNKISSINKVISNQSKILIDDDIVNELVDENNFHDISNKRVSQSLPEIKIDIGSQSYKCIVDSGSEANVISSNKYEEIKKSLDCNIPELPVSNLAIIGVTGVRSKRVTKQAQIDLKIKNKIIPSIFLVVPDLHTDIIIGCEFFERNKAKINFIKNCLEIEFENDSIMIEFVKSNTEVRVGGLRVIKLNKIACYRSEIEPKNIKEELEYNLKVEQESDNVTLNLDECSIEQQINNKIEITANENSKVNGEQELQLRNILLKNKDVFSDRPGCIKNYMAKLNIKNEVPFLGRSYPVPFSKRKAMQEELNKMIELGIIEESKSPYNNPLVCVVKKDSSIRACLDSRKLNQHLVADRQSTEMTEEIFQKFTGAKYFTTLDLTQGFWQVELDKESRKYVAFTYGGRNLQFKRLPFGLSVSTALFTKALNKILGPEFFDYVTCYVDDILISTTTTFKDHLDHIDKVLSRLRENGVTVKLKKSEFLKQRVKFLGYILSDEGITMDPEKIDKIKNFRTPRNLKELQSFLGLCNYYRKFQKNYARLTSQFNHILSSKKHWRWGEHEQNLFEEIKNKFLKTIILRHPNWNKPFYISTDASDLCVAAILYQINEHNEEEVVAFASRSLLDIEKSYSVTEKELLAVVFACKKFRTYIIGHFNIIVRSDHKALSFFKYCRLTHGRLLRWSLILQEYNLDIEYVKGKENVPADVLSRIDEESYEKRIDKYSIKIFNNKIETGVTNREINVLFKNLELNQKNDSHYGEIVKRLNSNEPNKVKDSFLIFDRILFQRNKHKVDEYRVCIPECKQKELIRLAHLRYGHFGGHKIYCILKEYCVFPKMEKTIKQLLKTCDICQKAKSSNIKQIGSLQPIIPTEVRQLIAVDLIGELPTGRGGVKYIFVLVDVFSKFVKLYPLRRANTKTLLSKILSHYIPLIGDIQAILSDHGSQFTSDLWYKTLNEKNIKTIHSSVYHPQSNPTERVNKEVNKMCRIYCNKKHTAWPLVLSFIEECLNLSVHNTTEQIPYEVMFGKSSKCFIQRLIKFPMMKTFDHAKIVVLVRENLIRKAELRKIKYDNKIKPITYRVGEKVLVKTHKLSDLLDKKIKKFFLLYHGPYEIVQIKLENAYVLKQPDSDRIVGTYNTTQLKKYIE